MSGAISQDDFGHKKKGRNLRSGLSLTLTHPMGLGDFDFYRKSKNALLTVLLDARGAQACKAVAFD